MVLSKINNNISFPELKKIHNDDNKMESELYTIYIYDLPVIIAIGKVKRNFEKDNIIFFPIYLINKNKKAIQIGVYEIDANYYLEYLNDDGELDLERNTSLQPLLYKFVTKSMIEKERLIDDSEETTTDASDDLAETTNTTETNYDATETTATTDASDDPAETTDTTDTTETGDDPAETTGDKDTSDKTGGKNEKSHHIISIPENRKDIFILTKGIEIPPLLKEETKKTATDIIQKYHTKNSDNWIVKYMKNNYYDIVENEGGCDSFFSCIRDAFSQLAQQTTIQKLRKKFADCVSQDIFIFYKENYNNLYNALNDITKNIKNLNIEYDKIRETYNKILDRNEKKQLTEKGKSIKLQHDTLVYEKKFISQFLKEFKFMKNIDNIEKFKKYLSSCEFWGNKWSIQWAITLMEYCLNIKVIFFSKEYYRENDYSNIIQLGSHRYQLNNALERKRIFEPDYYIMIMMDQSKSSLMDYKLISYKKKYIFTFSELPYSIKKTVVNKYNEKNAGLFSVIPEFNKFKKTIVNKNNEKNDIIETNIEELSESTLKGLYDDNIMFVSYINSNDKVFPGFGIGEKIPFELFINFVNLALIPDWRKKLSNEWKQPFTLDNHSWNSVEHYYQASKFKKNNPAFYLTFSLDSNSELSKNVEKATAAGGKTGKYKDDVLLRPENIEIDPEFYKSRHQKELYDAQYAKFTQNNDLKHLLMSTKNAKLMHYVKNKPLEEYKQLMEIREKLLNE
jgi:predicted NAD-dependent protein-ADP-ribosyltransferase YbiA (DUF1768 family)/archaellum component FlaC